jgi:hypothetical protein
MPNFRTAEAAFRPLGCSSRMINALCRQGIYNLADLSRVTEWELARWPGIGPASLSQLKIYLRTVGPSVELHRRPKTATVQFQPEVLTAIDAWAIEHEGIDSRAAAVRRLVEMSLACPTKAKQ